MYSLKNILKEIQKNNLFFFFLKYKKNKNISPLYKDKNKLYIIHYHTLLYKLTDGVIILSLLFQM